MEAKKAAIFALLLLIAAQAFAQHPTLSVDYAAVSIARDDSIGITVLVGNPSDSKACFTLKAESYYRELAAELPVSELCLNANEKTRVTMTLTSSRHAAAGDYEVALTLKHLGWEQTELIRVKILGEAAIELESNHRIFSKEGYTKTIPVEVINNTGKVQEITLNAESELFLPAFKPYKVRLQPNKSMTAELVININETTIPGSYTLPIFARTTEHYVEREVSFELIEPEQEAAFTLYFFKKSLVLEKGGEDEISFYIKSLVDAEQTVNLIAISELQASLGQYVMTLAPNEKRYNYLKIAAGEAQAAGDYNAEVYAWSADYNVRRVLDIELEKEHSLGLSIPNNGIELRPASVKDFEVFEVEITNNGDYDERIMVSVDNDYNTILVNISEQKFRLEAGESKTIYIAAQPSYDAEPGIKKIYLVIESSSTIRKREPLYIRVLEAAEKQFIEGSLEITSCPEKIILEQGKAVNVALTIKNPTDKDIEDIKLKIHGLNSRIFFPTLYLASLEAGASATLYGKLEAMENAQLKNYDLTLELSSGPYLVTEEVRLEVIAQQSPPIEQEGSQTASGPAGLLSLADFAIEAVAGLTILILLVFIFIGVCLLLGSVKSLSGRPPE